MGDLDNSRQQRRFTALGVLALAMWASAISCLRRCSEDLGPLTSAAMQWMAGGVVGIFVNLLLGKLRPENLQFLRRQEFYYRAALFTGYIALLNTAIGIIERAQLPLVTLLNYLWPTFTMLLSVIVFKQPSRIVLLVLGSVIVFVGLSVEIVGDELFGRLTEEASMNTVFAALLASMAAFTWGLYTVMNRRWSEKAGAALGLPFVMLIVSVALFVLRALFHEESHYAPGIILPTVYLMMIAYVANLCWDIGTRRGSITVLSLLADGLPWASLTVSSMYLGVLVGTRTWISAILIVAGALLSRYSLRVGTERT